jgi:hypothetical protein
VVSVTNEEDKTFDGILIGAMFVLTTIEATESLESGTLKIMRKMNNKYTCEPTEATTFNES